MSENRNDENYVPTVDEVREETVVNFQSCLLYPAIYEPSEPELEYNTGLCVPARSFLRRLQRMQALWELRKIDL